MPCYSPIPSSSAEKWPGWRRFWAEMKRAVPDTSRARPLKIHPPGITTFSSSSNSNSGSSLLPLFLSAGRIFLCRGPRSWNAVSSVRSGHSASRNPWIRPCVYSPPSFRDKDETMIDRRREGGEESFESSRGEAVER